MKKLLVIASLLAIGSFANAAGSGIGPAGCGLGNVVMGKDTQVLAATTNGTSGSQTFGITSGTSNCGHGSGMAKLENFIEVNQVALANDAARGQGETIANLAQILGCSNAQTLGAELKSNYSTIFAKPAATTTEISNGVVNTVQKNAELSRSCGA